MIDLTNLINFMIYLVVGLLTGIISALLGIGGGILLMPVLSFGFHFEPAIVVGTTLTAIVFSAISGSYQHIKMKGVDKDTAKIVGIYGVIGVVIGSVVFEYIKNYDEVINLLLGVIFMYVALKMIHGIFSKKFLKHKNLDIDSSETNKIKRILGLFVGFLSGITGASGGSILVPSFIQFLKFPVKIAIGTSTASFVIIVIIGAIIKIFQDVVNIEAAILLGIGAAIGGIYGAKLTRRFSSNTLKIILGAIFFYISLKYIFIYFGVSV